ncbi:uncharacterized protein LOC132737116 [Ruditapes philippinarum]|uniref:uncharacterized protein LOC132737116 n=1 Tax=Ruditapes philippinarum TaxID=129788 RepID=UPI00295C037A|nr:uncharacterized protein LOC132737116 [Ruditapes philippinarum]
MTRSAQKRKEPVRFKDRDQPTVRNRRSKPIAQIPHVTTIPKAVTAMIPSIDTPPSRSPISARRAHTSLANQNVSNTRAYIPLATPPTPTQIAPTPPAMVPTCTRGAPTPLPMTPIQQQVDLVRQLVEKQESMASKSPESKMEGWRKVLDQNTRNLKKYLIPNEIIHLDTGFELFDFIDKRDIQEESNTTKKNEAILTRVRSKGIKGYTDFKKRLEMTHQSKLADLLTYKERGLNTEEIEQQLNQMLEEKLTRTEYDELRRQLQGDLITFYRKRCSSIPLSPLLEEKETPLIGFYVMPNMVAVKQKSLICHEEERTPIKSLGDLFTTGSEDQQEIYLLADAGYGKTAFSKYLAITWCQAHRQDKQYDGNKCFKDIELKALSKFEFLFLVFLRDHTSVSHIDDMIRQQFSLHLLSLKSLDEISCRAKLNEVLSKEKCLIILDGLDEWTHPDYSCCNEVTEKIPHRCIRDNCVILTTTRPWKLGVSNLKSSQMDKKVELVQLNADSTRQLEYNAIRKMSGVNNDGELQSKIQEINKVIRDRRLEHMQVIPLLLMYIVCLWCNNILIGNSKHEVYTNIIEFLLSRTSKKQPEVKPCRYSPAHEIPEYFKSHEFCKKFYSLIKSLAELAYQTLFDENRENTLVFDRTVAEKYLKADDMKFTLHSGILSESRSTTLIKGIIKVSFSHKTVQEFFAAIFISSQSDAHKTVVEKCRNIQDILDMSIICEFISKMNADRMCAISNDLMSVINKDEETRDYRTRGRVDSDSLYNIQEMFMSCLQEMPESEHIQLCLQDFFIDKHTVHSEQLQCLMKQNKTNIKSLSISITSSSLHEIIDLFSLTDLSHIQKLYYNGNWEKAEIHQILFPSLQHVTLLLCIWTNDEENLSDNMARCQNLQYLKIFSLTLSHKLLDTFFKFISGQKSMKELTLRYLQCKEHGDHDCKRLNLNLSQHTKFYLQGLPRGLQLNKSTPSLVDVTLRSTHLDESSLLLSSDMLNIERVENKAKQSIDNKNKHSALD